MFYTPCEKRSRIVSTERALKELASTSGFIAAGEGLLMVMTIFLSEIFVRLLRTEGFCFRCLLCSCFANKDYVRGERIQISRRSDFNEIRTPLPFARSSMSRFLRVCIHRKFLPCILCFCFHNTICKFFFFGAKTLCARKKYKPHDAAICDHRTPLIFFSSMSFVCFFCLIVCNMVVA